jgi:hypothetical protein
MPVLVMTAVAVAAAATVASPVIISRHVASTLVAAAAVIRVAVAVAKLLRATAQNKKIQLLSTLCVTFVVLRHKPQTLCSKNQMAASALTGYLVQLTKCAGKKTTSAFSGIVSDIVDGTTPNTGLLNALEQWIVAASDLDDDCCCSSCGNGCGGGCGGCCDCAPTCCCSPCNCLCC